MSGKGLLVHGKHGSLIRLKTRPTTACSPADCKENGSTIVGIVQLLLIICCSLTEECALLHFNNSLLTSSAFPLLQLSTRPDYTMLQCLVCGD